MLENGKIAVGSSAHPPRGGGVMTRPCPGCGAAEARLVEQVIGGIWERVEVIGEWSGDCLRIEARNERTSQNASGRSSSW